jgi:hypothetical protein
MAALMNKFRNTTFDIGEHHGTISVGTQTLKIQMRKIMITANTMIASPAITYLII